MAEGVGFEPTVPAKVHRFSRPAQSTTLSPLRGDSAIIWRSYRARSVIKRAGALVQGIIRIRASNFPVPQPCFAALGR